MGEKIKVLSEGEILATRFEVELNHPLSINEDQQVHIQSDKFRLELKKKEFIKYGLAVLVAEKNLKKIKNL